MTPLLVALALLAAQAEDSAPAPAAAPQEAPLPPGAPSEDYPFVAWCYGSLRGYLSMHDEMMPEVTRIESAFRKPGATLEDDLKVYADMQRDGERQLQVYQAAMTAAEKASLRPINIAGGEYVRRGQSVWRSAPGLTKAQVAHVWMGWTIPARCEAVASDLKARSELAGAALQANQPN